VPERGAAKLLLAGSVAVLLARTRMKFGRHSVLCFWAAVVMLCLPAGSCWGFGIFGNTDTNDRLRLGARWSVDPWDAPNSGLERSLQGGLRYSLSGGSYQAFRDSFAWSGSPPAVADFQGAIQNAFAAWTKTDPATGLFTTLSFVPDLGTAVDSRNQYGAEIDVLPNDYGDSGLHAVTTLSWGSVHDFTLTSGAAYRCQPINGSDIKINSNPAAKYTLRVFQTLLTHEIGHSLGLSDVDLQAGPNGVFIDDNYDGTSSASALATLTNSFALEINPLDPDASPLHWYTVANGDPGFDTPGVDILMESALPGHLIGDPSPLRNDDYAGRQFLYPVIPAPEPSTLSLAALGLAGLCLGAARRRRLRRKTGLTREN
jgi:hypothetical protein